MTGQYSLDPALPVLVRPDGAVQVGWDPRRAVLVRPPRGLTASALAGVLRLMQSTVDADELVREAISRGPVDTAEFTGLIDALVKAGVARPAPTHPVGRTASIRIHGRGPLSDLLVDALRCSGARIKHSSQPHAVVRPEATDLVVLSDYLVAEPRMVRDLHDAGIPHLLVRVRDGVGLVGPLVVPGVTSCLGCADLHRSDRDAAWPAVAAQLRDTVGTADRATMLATAALALNQVDTVISAIRGPAGNPGDRPAPSTLSATLEFDVSTGSIGTRRWPRHPRCRC
ncbi:cyclodehydratase [Mycolicibacterium komossense]|uniref:Cyclodehydratase n=1 Tax=Mycolicibacterium komossense TaxID=1779 RepID=A0ABT3CC62_9MYCO|nr:cyclodehydratase [Mycolicibacterium komossense]MCV7227069.1 cyclodehydratase [Mycolicibacterium komossense]